MREKLSEHIKRMLPWLNESQRRKFLASEAISLGRGGIKEISAISGVHRNTIAAGIKELNESSTSPRKRSRSQTNYCNAAGN